MNRYLDDPTGTYRQAVLGDHDAFAAMVDHFQPRLEAYLKSRIDARIASRLGPADVVQELYLQRLKWADRRRSLSDRLLPGPLPTCSKGAFGWLRRIASRRLIDCHRRYFGSRKRDPAKEASLRNDGSDGGGLEWLQDGMASSPSTYLRASENRQRWVLWMERLSPKYEVVLKLKFFEKLSTPEIAERLGLQEATVSKRIVRGLQRLREILPTDFLQLP
ncbi:MAG: sigma-70 family RNA polymerase sigma factor [Pirellulaceae bacterium]